MFYGVAGADDWRQRISTQSDRVVDSIALQSPYSSLVFILLNVHQHGIKWSLNRRQFMALKSLQLVVTMRLTRRMHWKQNLTTALHNR